MRAEYAKIGVRNAVTQFRPRLLGFEQPAYSNWLNNNKVAGGSNPISVAENMRLTLGRSYAQYEDHLAVSGFSDYDEQLEEVWEKDLVKRARRELKLCLSAYIKRARDADAKEPVEEAEAHNLPRLLVEDQTKGWNRLSSAFFSAPEEGSIAAEDATAYLRGDDESAFWPREKVAFHRARYVNPVLVALNQNPTVLLTSPVGEGKSTIVAQVAKAIIDQHRPVYFLSDARVLDDPEFTHEIQWQANRPLIVLDDQLLGDRLPVWVSWPPGQKAGNILVSNHTRHLDRLTKSIGAVSHQSIPIGDVSPEEVTSIIDCLHEHRAVPMGQSKQKTRELMQRSLKFNRSLWPAQYAATRGYSLFDRIGRLLRQIEHEAEGKQKLFALAVIVVANQNLAYSGLGKERCKSLPKRSLIQRMVGGFDDLSSSFRASVSYHVDHLSDFIEGELLGRNLHFLSDPEINFRHPEVTRSMEKLLFRASRNGLHPARFDRWDFVEPLCCALPRDQHQAVDMHILLKRAVRQWSYGGSERYSHNLHEIVERCLVRLEKPENLHTEARIELLRARAVFLDRTNELTPELRNFAVTRLTVARGLVSKDTPYSLDLDIADTLLRTRIDDRPPEIEMKIDGEWAWRDWRFFAERGEQKFAREHPDSRQASQRIFGFLLEFPELALHGELVEYAEKSGLFLSENWESFAAGLVVCQSQLDTDEDEKPKIDGRYDLPLLMNSVFSFPAILWHLWNILSIKQQDILEEIKSPEWTLGRNHGRILEFAKLMRISILKPIAEWQLDTVNFFTRESEVDADWINRAVELQGVEAALRQQTVENTVISEAL